MAAPPLTRRATLAGGAALAASACGVLRSKPPPTVDAQAFDHATRIAFAPAAVALDEAAFPETVASGSMKKDAATLCTRCAVGTQVTLRVWREAGSDAEVALVTEVPLPVPVDGHLKTEVSGLAPATWYRYAFFSPDFTARSPIGKVRTAFPDDWAEPFTLGTTSCAKAAYGPFASLALLAEQPLDFWVHLGDVSYNDTAQTLDDYRAMYRAALKDPGYRALTQAAGGYLVWDDHDYWNNFDLEASGFADARATNARHAWFEALPVEHDDQERIWRSYRWGQTAELFLLDCRTERKPSTLGTPSEQYLSAEQMGWLRQALLDSPCHFKVLLTSTPITDMPPPLWGAQNERWQGYAQVREELLAFLDAQALHNVWFLTGDFHLGLVMRVGRTDRDRRHLEIAGGPAAQVNPLALTLEPGQEANRALAFPPEQFLFASGGYSATTVTFDPRSDSVRVVFKRADPQETTFDQVLRWG
jgi:phosphodiesterase/alkaline phosphatase D-like protein